MKALVILDGVLMAGYANLLPTLQMAGKTSLQIICSGMELVCFALFLYEVNKLTDKPAKAKQ